VVLMLESNRRRVRQLTGLEMWLFIVGRVLAAFGLGVLTMTYLPSVASLLAWPAVVVGMLILLVASRGLLRKPPDEKAT
jgi:hypothetical protein